MFDHLSRWLAVVAVAVTVTSARAADLRVTFAPTPGAVAVSDATVYADPADLQPTGIAARLLADDLGRVTGRTPAVVGDASQGPSILVGTLGHSRAIDALVAAGKLDVSDLRDHREAYRLQVVGPALVIVGSDRRGTAYGVTTLSRRLGVSPWYWWANVPTAHHDAVYVGADGYTDGSPTVRYRGIFLNDEAPAMSGWAKEHFGQHGGNGFNSAMYAHVFELLLRLRANYLWPAMWGEAFNEDDPATPKLANDYGIVMGTSHQEPMMRAQAEWDRRHKGTDWNFATDPVGMASFWRDGIRRNKAFDNLVTIGMRGRNDTPMIPGATVQQSSELLEKIVAAQRQILAEETGRPPEQVPQVWCLYKEVQSYYEHGLRVPDDVTLLWSDDNWGDLRRLPTAAERRRPGGAGIYYHFDYVGDPRNYKWIDTNPIPKVWEQMSMAHAYGADRVWVVNVGDLKPLEYPTSFFMDMAWDPAAMTKDRMYGYGRRWAEQQFGPAHAADVADLIAWYGQTNGRRKPELLDEPTYSAAHYGEADRVLADCRAMSAKAEVLADQMPADARDAYFQLVQHPVQATALVNELYIQAARNRLYAEQGRASANDAADAVEQLFKADAALSDRYNHVAGGFWNHMMDQTHLGYDNWQQPKANVMPPLRRVDVPDAAAMGVAVEDGGPDLPAVDALNQQGRTVEVFNKGRTPFPFTATADQPWVKLDPAAGTVDRDQPVRVSVDWRRAPVGESSVAVTLTGAGEPVTVRLPVIRPASPTRADLDGHAENAGVVSIDAARYSDQVNAGTLHWALVDGLGLTGSAMVASPSTAAATDPAHPPCLTYRIWVNRAGPARVTAVVSPTQAFVPGRGLRYAVAVDDEPPQVVDTIADRSRLAWERSVAEGCRRCTTAHTFAAAGYHTVRLSMVDPAVVLQKVVVDLGGLRPSYLGPPESYHRHTH